MSHLDVDRSARSNWPNRKINTTDLLDFVGAEGTHYKPDTWTLYCKSCEQSWPLRKTARDGLVWSCRESECAAYTAFKDLVELAADKAEIPEGPGRIAATLDALAAAGLRVPRACRRPQVLRSYQSYLADRKAHDLFCRRMSKRQLGDKVGGAVGLLLGGRRPHSHPGWWCATPAEVSQGVGWMNLKSELGATPEEFNAPAVVVPEWDTVRRVCGLWVVTAHAEAFRRVRHAEPGASCPDMVGPDHTYLAWRAHDFCLWIKAVHEAGGPTLPPVVLAHPPTDAAEAAVAAGVLPKAGYTAAWPDRGLDQVGAYALAKLVGAQVANADDVRRELAGSPPGFRAPRIGLGRALETTLRSGRGDYYNAALLSALAYAPADGEAWGWSREVLTYANRLYRKPRPHLQAQVARGLTVVHTLAGWVWAETGETLLDTPPVLARVYRGPDGRTRFHGFLVNTSRAGPDPVGFDTTRLLSDGAGVVLRTALRAGFTPFVHARVAPHVGAAAYHFYVQERAKAGSE